ncbi:MAG: TIM barrel protein [Acidobacteria bacterium]|nr:TIM barrel protein [Acidobacteriota bacterium]
MERREFIKQAGQASLTVGAMAMTTESTASTAGAKPLFQISLAQWSLHKSLFSKQLDNLDFPKMAQQFSIFAVEYVNQFFKDKAKDKTYLAELLKRSKDHGIENRLIMIDDEGDLGDPDKARRQQAVENHYQWVEAAKFLGCQMIRVNAESKGSYQEQQEHAADGVLKLTEFAAPNKIGIVVENHGSLSSNGKWLAGVMKLVNHWNCGTLPDFGNFDVSPTEKYDRYQGVTEMMPFAKAVSAKSHDFDDKGNEIHTDYRKMMKLVLAAKYSGFVGIEYEGEKMSEANGVRATKRLLETVHDELMKKKA